MTRHRAKKSSFHYQSLEPRQLLSANGASVHVTDGTLFIAAADSNDPAETFASDIRVSQDPSNGEIVFTGANQAEQRFDSADINRISYFGTQGNDRFENDTTIDSRISGFGGDDVLSGGSGADRLIGGNGNDELTGGAGDDYLTGNNGDDVLTDIESAASGIDRIYGGAGNDLIQSGAGNDFVFGGIGDDVIDAGAGRDYVHAGDGRDTVDGAFGIDVIYGGDGDDLIDGGVGQDRLIGGAGNDELVGGDDADFASGGDGNDILNGDRGDDILLGGEGNDVLRGGIGMDRIVSASVNVLDSSAGFDIIDAGDDSAEDLIIRHRFDSIVSDTGNDQLIDVSDVRAHMQSQFLVQNLLRSGWAETDSGLQFRTIREGSGPSPVETDRVRVNYTGTFTDLTVFDANGPIEFNLNQVIAGWTEGLQLMNVGGITEFAIPSDLGYGDRGVPGVIPPQTTLLFTVELLGIV